MKIGDLVVLTHDGDKLYLIAGECPERENNWPPTDGSNPLGRMMKLYRPEETTLTPSYEKWIEVINEGR